MVSAAGCTQRAKRPSTYLEPEVGVGTPRLIVEHARVEHGIELVEVSALHPEGQVLTAVGLARAAATRHVDAQLVRHPAEQVAPGEGELVSKRGDEVLELALKLGGAALPLEGTRRLLADGDAKV